MGSNAIRRDQLKFVYNTVKIIFDSPLREILIDDKQNVNMVEEVIPMFIAFNCLKQMREIEKKKAADLNAIREKRVRKGLSPDPEPEVVEQKVEEVTPAKKKTL